MPPDPTKSLQFRSWQRSSIYDLVPSEARTDGRLVGKLPLTLRDTTSADVAVGGVDFHIMAPRDIGGLLPSTILRTVPAAFAHDVEATKFVHVDFTDPDLPWRYTPRKAAGEQLLPWLALLVGSASELRINGQIVEILESAIFKGYDLTHSDVRAIPPYCWAHVQEDDQRVISRLLAPRELQARTEYLAVIVPTFGDDGEFAWGPDHTPSALPIFHSWRFWTGEAGDFETLALAIMPVQVSGLGRAPLAYRRPPVEANLQLQGAITSLGDPTDPAEVQKAREDLAAFKKAVDDLSIGEPLGRRVIGLPSYGRPWVDDVAGTTWTASLNADPRYRGTAGLGNWMGMEGQQELVDAAVKQLGALELVTHLIQVLAFGLVISRSLWTRRLPLEPRRQIHLFSPLMRRMLALGGSALAAITAPTSPLEAAIFSSAARRMLRRSAAWTRYTQDGFIGRGTLLEIANRCPPPPPKSLSGLPHVDDLANALGLRTPEEPVVLDLRPIGPEVEAAIDQMIGIKIDFANADFTRTLDRLTEAIAHEHGPCERHIEYLRDSHLGEVTTRELLIVAVRRCLLQTGWQPTRDVPPIDNHQVDIRDLRAFVGSVLRQPAPSPCEPANLDRAAAVVAAAIDPNGQRPPAWSRVQSRIDGIAIGTLEPPEIPIGIDFPTWTLLRDRAKEWILPGVDGMPKDAVIAMQTNPTFIDAYLVGLNKQLLDELHWRNVPVDRRSTPLLMFWGHVNFETNIREAEIKPIPEWGKLTDLGANQHQVLHPGDTTGKRDLIIVFRTDLFWRYPATLVYLVKRHPPPLPPGDPDADLKATPDFEFTASTRENRTFLGPIFQGALARDLVFFAFDLDPHDLGQYWLVLDEPPSEMRFRPRDPEGHQLGAAAPHGAAFAEATFDRKTRVAIDGQYLEDLGLRI